jgi:hypothetical protein
MWRPEFAYVVNNITEYFVARKQCKRRQILHSQSNTEHFYTVEKIIRRESMVAFP